MVRWQVSATSDKQPRADNVNDAVDDYNNDAEHDADSGDDADANDVQTTKSRQC